MTAGATTARIVRCPACGGKSVYAPENPHRPFCSARCRQHDFGAWATEDYRIAQRPSGDEAGLDVPADDPERR